MNNPQYYLGVMSGTSLDGVDVALVDFARPQPHVAAAACYPMPSALRQRLATLIQSGQTTLQALGELDHRLGQLYADCLNAFLAQQHLAAADRAAGIHGQTVWHSPQGAFPFTMQIGDMNWVAAKTGITVVGDFRRKDMAFGGQGAPLVPAFHQAVFADPQRFTVVLNIGGISNISVLAPNRPVIGYDTGVGNALLDAWIERHLGKPFDENAQWASGGKVDDALLNHLLDEPYFRRPPPKSTGREHFNLAWLERKIAEIPPKPTALSPQDVQATLAEVTVCCTVQELQRLAPPTLPCRLLVCGGGARNPLLMKRFAEQLPHWQVTTTTEVGMHADYVEAAAFAWLAYRRLHHLPGNLPAVTGAQCAVGLGAIFPHEPQTNHKDNHVITSHP